MNTKAKAGKNKCHSRKFLSGIATHLMWQGQSYRKQQGFTLVELLVVVLIIGILSAVALPQYQKAVTKARATEAMAIVQTLKKAVSVWALEHGTNQTVNFLGGTDIKNASLDIDIPCEPSERNSGDCTTPKEINYAAACGFGVCEVTASGGDETGYYQMVSFLNESGQWYFNKCGYNGNVGKTVCDMLEAQGWDKEENWEY